MELMPLLCSRYIIIIITKSRKINWNKNEPKNKESSSYSFKHTLHHASQAKKYNWNLKWTNWIKIKVLFYYIELQNMWNTWLHKLQLHHATYIIIHPLHTSIHYIQSHEFLTLAHEYHNSSNFPPKSITLFTHSVTHSHFPLNLHSHEFPTPSFFFL